MALFPGLHARRKLLLDYGAREDNRSRHTDHPAGRHSIQTNQHGPPPSPPCFTTDGLPATTLPIYPGLGQAPNMLACVPSGVVICVMFKVQWAPLHPD